MSQRAIPEKVVIPMSNYLDKYVKCPFFSKQEGKKIYCEGFEDGIHIHLSFKDNSLLLRHRHYHCNSVSGCQTCPIYKVASEKYEKGG